MFPSSILLLLVVRYVSSVILYEELNASVMHPRTFYLTPNQEFLVISKVLCEDIPCPEFRVIHDYPHFIQQRSYRAAKFLRLTTPLQCSFNGVLDDGRKKMEKYIKGANNREEKYRQTLPLLIRVDQVTTSKSKNPWCRMSYSIHFYTPHYWGTMATPQEIILDYQDIEDNLQVYVHTFAGDVENELLKEIELFRRDLDALKLCYKKMTFYIAVYDVPHNPNDSRLELWFLKCTS